MTPFALTVLIAVPVCNCGVVDGEVGEGEKQLNMETLKAFLYFILLSLAVLGFIWACVCREKEVMIGIMILSSCMLLYFLWMIAKDLANKNTESNN